MPYYPSDLNLGNHWVQILRHERWNTTCAMWPLPQPPLLRTNAKLRYCHVQSRSQSIRYPCPAERKNEDLWEDPFELAISLAINRACAVPPKVDKQAKNNNFVTKFPILYAARDGCASSGYKRFESKHGVQTPVKYLLWHINQHHVRGCCNFNALSNPNDRFVWSLTWEREPFEYYIENNRSRVSENDDLP